MNEQRSWYITVRPAKRLGGFVAHATETQPPDDDVPLDFPCEVHFEFGDTYQEARARLEASLPPFPR